jgi:hypothetical protein
MDDLNGTTALLDEQSDEQHPSGLPRPRGLFFRSNQQSSPEEDPATSTTDGATPSPLDLDESVSAGEWDDPSDPSDTNDQTSSPASDTPTGRPLSPLTKAALRATIAQGVIIGSGMAHRIAARSAGQQAVGLYVADTEDADNIAGPLASIAHRRGGIAGKVSPDTNDAIQAAMGIAGYMSKQIGKTVAAKEIDAHLAAGGTLETLAQEAAQ